MKLILFFSFTQSIYLTSRTSFIRRIAFLLSFRSLIDRGLSTRRRHRRLLFLGRGWHLGEIDGRRIVDNARRTFRRRFLRLIGCEHVERVCFARCVVCTDEVVEYVCVLLDEQLHDAARQCKVCVVSGAIRVQKNVWCEHDGKVVRRHFGAGAVGGDVGEQVTQFAKHDNAC